MTPQSGRVGPGLETYPELQPLGEEAFQRSVAELAAQFWLPPHALEASVSDLVRSCGLRDARVVVSGQCADTSIYVIDQRAVLALTPGSSLRRNRLLRELYAESTLPEASWGLLPRDARLDARLDLPRVLLINPCVLETHPVPRLCLSIGLVAAYLRKTQTADVRLLDMQVGTGIAEIVEQVSRFRPEMIGISISYGQKHVAFDVLDALWRAQRDSKGNALFVLGNIIPASYPQEFLQRYPGAVVACAEGEPTAVGLAEHLRGRRELGQVPGLAYLDERGRLRSTPKAPMPMDDLPLPALDTVQDVAACAGAVTLEISRGCQWSRCTFCPREHKSATWKAMPTPQVLEQLGQLREVCERFGMKKHIFLADEEFVGGLNDHSETQRVADLTRRLVASDIELVFDPAARVDQVFSPKQDRRWHVERMKMWDLCRQAGMERLFLGVESGSNSQLQRLGKGIRVEDSIRAIRLLSALGIPLRFGFITFDPLMRGLRELKENIATLGRTDAFMRPVDVATIGYEELFARLTEDEAFVQNQAMGKPCYAGVSYMMSPMEVLIKSPYARMLKEVGQQDGRDYLLEAEPDTNMGRYCVTYVDPVIGDISAYAQRWIDRNFSVAYTVKSLYKVAPAAERPHLISWMVAYRRVCLLVLKACVRICDDDPEPLWAGREAGLPEQLYMLVERLRLMRKRSPADRRAILEACLDAFDDLVRAQNEQLFDLLRAGTIRDSKGRLATVLGRWFTREDRWTLINDAANVVSEPTAEAAYCP